MNYRKTPSGTVPEGITTKVGTHGASGALSAGSLSVVLTTCYESETRGQTIEEQPAVVDTDLHIVHRLRHQRRRTRQTQRDKWRGQ